MDFVNQGFAQVTNLFRSMSAGARIVAGLLLAVIVISLAYLFNHQLARPDSYLMGGESIPSDEINHIAGVLGKAGLKNFQIDGNRIRVPRGEEATYMAALLEQGALPGNYGSYLQKALSDGGMMVSKSRQAQLNKFALQMELSRIVRNMKGISNAMVIYDIPEERGFGPKKASSSATASVSVATVGGTPLDDNKVMSIRHMVSSAIAGMSPGSVAVTDLESGFTYPAVRPGQISVGMQDPYTQNKMTHEKLWTEKIRNGLNWIPGVIVACNVDLTKQLEHDQEKTQHDPKTVNVAVDEETKTLSSQAPQTSGPPGVGSQGAFPPNQPAVARGGASGAKTDEEMSRSTVRSLPSTDLEHIKMAGLTPDRVTVAIAVPSSYIEQVWLQRNKPVAGQDPPVPARTALKLIEEEVIQSIRAHVASLVSLPNAAAPDPIKQVTVTVFEKLPVEQLAEPGFSDHALAWFGDHWSTLGTGMLGLVSLVMLRSMVRAAPASESLPAATLLDDADDDVEDTGTISDVKIPTVKPTPAARLKRREKGGPSLREELVEIVREDPDAAANVLRSWINSST